jgi:hypothetical protein
MVNQTLKSSALATVNRPQRRSELHNRPLRLVMARRARFAPLVRLIFST